MSPAEFGHHAESLVGDVEQTGGEQHAEPVMITVRSIVQKPGRVGLHQTENREHRENRQFDGDDEQFGSADQLRAHHVDQHHRDDQPDSDDLSRPGRRLPWQQRPDVAREAGAVQGHRDDPAEELKDVEATRDQAVAEAADEEPRRAAPARARPSSVYRPAPIIPPTPIAVALAVVVVPVPVAVLMGAQSTIGRPD
jgi:hypothetical protein